MALLRLTSEEAEVVKGVLEYGLEESQFDPLDPIEQRRRELIQGIVKDWNALLLR